MLVVEDKPNLHAYLRELLSPACEVLTAADGQEALSREAPVDLIITDAMMPRLSGTELLAHLKADPARACQCLCLRPAPTTPTAGPPSP